MRLVFCSFFLQAFDSTCEGPLTPSCPAHAPTCFSTVHAGLLTRFLSLHTPNQFLIRPIRL